MYFFTQIHVISVRDSYCQMKINSGLKIFTCLEKLNIILAHHKLVLVHLNLKLVGYDLRDLSFHFKSFLTLSPGGRVGDRHRNEPGFHLFHCPHSAGEL